MTQIVLNEEQAKQVAAAHQPVQVCDTQGNVLGVITPIWTDADIAEAQRILATDQPWHTTEQMLQRLRSLETT